MGRRLALLITTYQYQDTGLRQLITPARDAEALAAVLRDPAIAGFEVTTLINEPHHRVGQAIGDFYRDRRRDDLTLLYFTGHGLKDDDGRLYLAMTNTLRDNLLFTGLSAEQVDQVMESCVSRQKVLVLDCCYSGAFPAQRTKADTMVHTQQLGQEPPVGELLALGRGDDLLDPRADRRQPQRPTGLIDCSLCGLFGHRPAAQPWLAHDTSPCWC